MSASLPVFPRAARLAAAVTALVVAGCTESGPTTPLDVTDVVPSYAKGGNKVSVDAADPDSAIAGTTLEVRVIGSGFVEGSTVRLLLAGNSTAKVVTNSSTFVDDQNILADITIAIDAEIALYDIEVRGPRGKNGIGTELFAVKENPNGNGGGPGAGYPPITLELEGGMTTPAVQDGWLGADTRNNLEVIGAPAACEDPAGDCFTSALALGVDVVDGSGNLGLAACQVPNGMSLATQNMLFSQLSDPAQARWRFEGDVKKRGKQTALLRTFWYETGDPTRFDLLTEIDQATETSPGSGVWDLENGTLKLYYSDLGPLECPWVGTITMTVGSP